MSCSVPVSRARSRDDLVCQVQCRHDGDAVQSDDFAAVADLAHALVEELGAVEQLGALVRTAGDDVFLFQNANAQGRALRARSRAVFHRLEATDHGFDARAYLLVAIEQRGLLRGEHLLPLAQRAIFFLELLHGGEQLVDALLEAFELEIDGGRNA